MMEGIIAFGSLLGVGIGRTYRSHFPNNDMPLIYGKICYAVSP